jgi:biopolymer transport protein ExbD
MNFRKRMTKPARIGLPMAPMVGVVFLLLIFFLLNLKVISPEGNPAANLPIIVSGPSAMEQRQPDIKVGLRSDRDGNLLEVTLDSRNLGNDDTAFELLNREILRIVSRPGRPLSKDVEVEIDADFETQYKYVVRAISKCSGRYDPDSKQIARFVEKIKFASPHKPKG